MRQRQLPLNSEQEVEAQCQRTPQQQLAVNVCVVRPHRDGDSQQHQNDQQILQRRFHARSFLKPSNPSGLTSKNTNSTISGTPMLKPAAIGRQRIVSCFMIARSSPPNSAPATRFAPPITKAVKPWMASGKPIM